MSIKIGFSKSDITPPLGIVLGGYAGYRPCSGVHDPLHCKAVVLEQEGIHYCLISLDLVCVDESLYRQIANKVSDLGINAERLIVSAIHTHAAPHGVISGKGPLTKVNCSFEESKPEPLKGIHTMVTLQPRLIEAVATAEAELQERTSKWEEAKASGADATSLRLLKTYVEGAWVNLEFAKSMAGITQLDLPVTVFSFAGLEFATIPGELFSTLQPEVLSIIAYTNGYFRYVCPKEAYEANHYEAMAAIIARGGGEHLINRIQQLRQQLHHN